MLFEIKVLIGLFTLNPLITFHIWCQFDFQIVFKSDKTRGCTRFSVDLDNHGSTTCLPFDHHPNLVERDGIIKREPQMGDRTMEEIMLRPRELDPNGYKYSLYSYFERENATINC